MLIPPLSSLDGNAMGLKMIGFAQVHIGDQQKLLLLRRRLLPLELARLVRAQDFDGVGAVPLLRGSRGDAGCYGFSDLAVRRLRQPAVDAAGGQCAGGHAEGLRRYLSLLVPARLRPEFDRGPGEDRAEVRPRILSRFARKDSRART